MHSPFVSRGVAERREMAAARAVHVVSVLLGQFAFLERLYEPFLRMDSSVECCPDPGVRVSDQLAILGGGTNSPVDDLGLLAAMRAHQRGGVHIEPEEVEVAHVVIEELADAASFVFTYDPGIRRALYGVILDLYVVRVPPSRL